MEHGPEESPPHCRRVIDGNHRTRMRRQRRSDPNRTPPVKDRPCMKPVATGKKTPGRLSDTASGVVLGARASSPQAVRAGKASSPWAQPRLPAALRRGRDRPEHHLSLARQPPHRRSAPSWPPSSNAWRRTSATLTVEDASKQLSTAVTARVSWRIGTSLALWPMRCGASMANAIVSTPGA